ncbi:MAG: GNAT family N-acetyltransferase [bacterium]
MENIETINSKEILYRPISRLEIDEVRNIDRYEIVMKMYRYEDGKIIIIDSTYTKPVKWNTEGLDNSIKHLYDIFDNSGYIIGAFDKSKLVGIVALDSRPISKDQLQLYFLHVDNNYRENGVGKTLLEKAKSHALSLGAKQIYISATESEHTVKFYLNNGGRVCKLEEVNESLFQKETLDIPIILNLK